MDPEVRAWRVQERARLKGARQNLPSSERQLLTEAIARNLDTLLDRQSCRILGLYWPIKGEFDLRDWATRLGKRKRCALALPVVVREQAPLEYWRWQPGDPMARGFWGIMVPERREPVTPDVALAPLVGFSGLYRLGHGGGYFDRTLAAMQPKPLAIGIGTETGRLTGYAPQPHDIPMDVIVTEAAIHRCSPAAEAADEHP
jgi:5,10-methenyltetrahydrofolate synthetase